MAMGQSRAETLGLAGPARARRKFLRRFPGGFRDPTYLDWERDYKVAAHREWRQALGPDEMRALLEAGEHAEIAARALRVEQRARHPMLFSSEKMALRDAVRAPGGAQAFAEGLYRHLHGPGSMESRFDAWCDVVAGLPARGKRVATWPVVTVFGALAQPKRHLFVKPRTMRAAAQAYGRELPYRARPSWDTYKEMLAFAREARTDVADLRPRDMIDVQSYLWVLGSDEYT